MKRGTCCCLPGPVLWQPGAHGTWLASYSMLTQLACLARGPAAAQEDGGLLEGAGARCGTLRHAAAAPLSARAALRVLQMPPPLVALLLPALSVLLPSSPPTRRSQPRLPPPIFFPPRQAGLPAHKRDYVDLDEIKDERQNGEQDNMP